MRIFLILLFWLPIVSEAQPIFECPECPVEPISSATHRDQSFASIMSGYQFINTWVPNKITGSYTQIFNRDWSLELEYSTSKRDITIAGYSIEDVDEKRYTFFAKYYVGTSFHVSLGPYVYDITFENEEYKVQGYGAAFSIGNRWQYRPGITFGVDWVRINRPVSVTKDNVSSDDADKIEKAGKIFRTIPAVTFFGANIGYTF